ncbi:MAG: ATP synthase F1 subunit delta [Bacteroidetes bacterium]|nr:MAG: ATP synthase F1 subunit delta [Bacteroidota bacterium]
MIVTKSASRYAKALLELATEQGKLDQVSADMKAVINVFEDTRDFQLFLDSPVIGGDKKFAIFKELFPQFDELTTAFIQLMIRNKRENILGEIAHSYGKQLQSQLGINPVTITSASALDDKTKSAILSKLEKSLNGKLEVEEKIDADLIGGFIVQVGDTRIDASVANKLNSLKVSLTR